MDAIQVKITVALVAALAALIVAIIQSIAQWKNSHAVEELRGRLDLQRTEHSEYLKAHLKLVLDGKEQQLQGFKIILQRAQLLRDRLRSLHSDLDAYSPEAHRDEIRGFVEGVIQSFAEHQVALTKEGRNIAHSLKNASARAGQELAVLPPSGSKANKSFRRKVLQIDEELGQLQAALREEGLKANALIVEAIEREIASR